MPLSASIDFDLTARGVITAALRKLRVIGEGETPSAQEASDGQQALNLLLKGWQKYENLWRLTEGSVTLVADTYSYALTPVPHRVISARYRDANSRDLPLILMTREDYYDLPLKSTTGIPTQYYVDYQRSAATLLLWQAQASVTTETIRYAYQKKFDDIDTLDDDVEVRSEWLNAVVYNLAEELGPEYGMVGTPNFAKIEQQARLHREQLLDDDREDEIRFVPGYRW